MSTGDKGAPKRPRAKPGQSTLTAHPGATFGNQPAGLAVQVNAENLHLNVSNLTALGRLAESNPEIAMKIVESSGVSAKYDTRKYISSVIMTGIVCLAIVGSAASVIILKGFWAGIVLFMAVVAVLALVTVVYTGKAQDISWTANLIRREPEPEKEVD